MTTNNVVYLFGKTPPTQIQTPVKIKRKKRKQEENNTKNANAIIKHIKLLNIILNCMFFLAPATVIILLLFLITS